MEKLNFGSKYNPTGEPGFYMPYPMMIDVIICGNSDGVRQAHATEAARLLGVWNSMRVEKLDAQGNRVDSYRSINEAAAANGTSAETVKRRARAEKELDGYFYKITEGGQQCRENQQ